MSFFAPNWAGALSLLFPDDPGGRLLYLSAIDLKKWESPLKQHARLHMQHERA